VLTLASVGYRIWLWDLTKRTLCGSLTDHMDEYSRVCQGTAISPDGRHLVSTAHSSSFSAGERIQVVRLWNVASNTLLRRIYVHDDMTCQIYFSRDGSHLHINQGRLDLRCLYYPNTLPRTLEFDTRHWIIWNGHKVIWLPAEYRPQCMAVRENILAMGHATGEVTFIHLNWDMLSADLMGSMARHR
jgi:WD40 repeat protein